MTDRKISFYTWLQNYVNSDDAIGDLARDCKNDSKCYGSLFDDSGFPRYSNNEQKIRKHLTISRNASVDCIAVFDSAFLFYRDFMKKRGFDI